MSVRPIAILLAAVLLGGCAGIPWARHGATPEPVEVADDTAARVALNARVYDAVVRHASRLFHRRDAIAGFRARAASLRGTVVAQPGEAGLYAGLATLLAHLDDDHSYVTSPTARRQRDAALAGTMTADTGLRTLPVGGTWVVSTVRADSPAAAAGVRPGWQLVDVDGVLPAGAAPPIEGVGIVLRLVDEHAREHRLTLVPRMMPPLPRHAARRLEGDIAYLWFEAFDRDTYHWFEGQMDALEASPPRGIVLDLRGNGGGNGGLAAMTHAWFHAGEQPLVTLRHRGTRRTYVAGPMPHHRAEPMVVLVDAGTASMAEILAARMQEAGRATVVGQRTRGAATGTRGVELPDGGLLHIGMLGLATPGGQVLEKVGMRPDIVVEPDWQAVREGGDPVLDAALAQLAGRTGDAAEAP
jgi:carboxyl-terminal processing protease